MSGMRETSPVEGILMRVHTSVVVGCLAIIGFHSTILASAVALSAVAILLGWGWIAIGIAFDNGGPQVSSRVRRLVIVGTLLGPLYLGSYFYLRCDRTTVDFGGPTLYTFTGQTATQVTECGPTRHIVPQSTQTPTEYALYCLYYPLIQVTPISNEDYHFFDRALVWGN